MSWVSLGTTALSVGAKVGASYLTKKNQGGGGGGGGGAAIEFLDTRNEDQRKVDSSFADFISKYLPEFVPGEAYEGEFVAPMSGFEKQGLGVLQEFLDAPAMTELLPAAKDQVMKTLTGGFDPQKSDYFRALRETAQQQRSEAIDVVNRDSAARGNFFSSERLRNVGEVGTKTANFLNLALAELANEERGRQERAVGDALRVDADFTKAPLKKVAAALSFGSLPRELEQAELEALYQDFQRIRKEKALPATLAAGAFQGGNDRTIGYSDSSPGSNVGNFLGPIVQQILPMILKSALSN